jgi:hypothetical protein
MLLLRPVWKEDFKTFCPMSRIRLVIARSAPRWHIQSTLSTAPDMCKNVSLAVFFGSNGNSYSLYTVRYVCMYTYTLQYKDACRSKEIILGKAVNSACRRFASPGLASWFSSRTVLDVETKRKICNPFINEITNCTSTVLGSENGSAVWAGIHLWMFSNLDRLRWSHCRMERGAKMKLAGKWRWNKLGCRPTLYYYVCMVFHSRWD